LISHITEKIVTGISLIFPYEWIDRLHTKIQKKSTEIEERNDEKIKKITEKNNCSRYLVSEIYILGWLGLSILFLIFNQWLDIIVVLILMPRVIEILNKEICVVLFEKCKITEGYEVSNPSRVITLAFTNYLTIGMLFALLYTKVGTFKIESATNVSPLETQYALIESLSILFTLSPTYSPLDIQTTIITLIQSGFCFIFGILILATFIGLVRIRSNKKTSINE